MTVRPNYIRCFAVAAASVLVLTAAGCGKKQTQSVSSGAVPPAAPETMSAAAGLSAPVSTAAASAPTQQAAASTAAKTEPSAPSVRTSVETYEKGNIRICYPVVSGSEDPSRLKKVNALLKKNALSILENYPDSKEPLNQDKDTLNVKCRVVSADSNRITVVYDGYYHMDMSAYPNNIFYSNTVSMKNAANLGFKDFTDPYTMAGYVLSSDVKIKNDNKDIVEAFMNSRKNISQDQYTECFRNADFPLKTGPDGKTANWPDSFSYEENGKIYFSVPVIHAIGDYILIEYAPDAK